jgi:hypothetical protein
MKNLVLGDEFVLGFKWTYFWLFVAEEKSAKS